MQFKNGWMAIAAFTASAMIFTPTVHGAPAENECLTVTSDTTLSSSVTYGNLVVNSGVTLTIATGVVLTLDGTSDTCTNYIHQIDGSVVLNGSGAIIRFTETSQTVQGDGDIDGLSNTAKIEIGSGLRLRSKMLIHGAMVIDRAGSSGTATFDNYRDSAAQQGVVRADLTGGSSGSPYVLELAPNLILDDTHSGSNRPRYEAAGGDDWSQMKFSREADGNPDPVLVGNFEIDDCGDLLIDQNVKTNGSLTFTQGTLIVASGKCFYYGLVSICITTNVGTCP
jgi:hypothetical protein